MEEKDFYTANEAKDILFGKVGTPTRDKYEERLQKKLKLYTLDEIKEIHIGKVGTTERDDYEAKLQEYLIGEVKKPDRKAKDEKMS